MARHSDPESTGPTWATLARSIGELAIAACVALLGLVWTQVKDYRADVLENRANIRSLSAELARRSYLVEDYRRLRDATELLRSEVDRLKTTKANAASMAAMERRITARCPPTRDSPESRSDPRDGGR